MGKFKGVTLDWALADSKNAPIRVEPRTLRNVLQHPFIPQHPSPSNSGELKLTWPASPRENPIIPSATQKATQFRVEIGRSRLHIFHSPQFLSPHRHPRKAHEARVQRGYPNSARRMARKLMLLSSKKVVFLKKVRNLRDSRPVRLPPAHGMRPTSCAPHRRLLLLDGAKSLL